MTLLEPSAATGVARRRSARAHEAVFKAACDLAGRHVGPRPDLLAGLVEAQALVGAPGLAADDLGAKIGGAAQQAAETVGRLAAGRSAQAGAVARISTGDGGPVRCIHSAHRAAGAVP